MRRRSDRDPASQSMRTHPPVGSASLPLSIPRHSAIYFKWSIPCNRSRNRGDFLVAVVSVLQASIATT
jgi:hypothetical protein